MSHYLGAGIAKLVGGFLGDKFKTESTEEMLNRLTDAKHIEGFCANPNRKPYCGKVER